MDDKFPPTSDHSILIHLLCYHFRSWQTNACAKIWDPTQNWHSWSAELEVLLLEASPVPRSWKLFRRQGTCYWECFIEDPSRDPMIHSSWWKSSSDNTNYQLYYTGHWPLWLYQNIFWHVHVHRCESNNFWLVLWHVSKLQTCSCPGRWDRGQRRWWWSQRQVPARTRAGPGRWWHLVWGFLWAGHAAWILQTHKQLWRPGVLWVLPQRNNVG